MKPKLNLLKRSGLLMAGLMLMALGVGLSIKADLGTSPIASIPYVYSQQFPITVGVFMMILNLLLILLQIVLLRKQYQWIQLLQIPVALLFGVFIDLGMLLLHGLAPDTYLLKAACCLLSCVALGFGVFLEVKARVIYLAGEGLVMAVVQAFKMDFGKTKIALDSLMVSLGIISSLIFFRHIAGIREGTIAAALLVGLTARIFSHRLTFLDAWLGETVPISRVPVAERIGDAIES
jgi:uncharacterized membrane protein YczE